MTLAVLDSGLRRYDRRRVYQSSNLPNFQSSSFHLSPLTGFVLNYLNLKTILSSHFTFHDLFPIHHLTLDIISILLYCLYKMYTGDVAMTTKISTADARKNLSNIVNRVSFGNEPIILTRRGEDIAALVGMDELRLLQELEDRIDIADAIKALKEPGEDIPAAQFWKKLGL